MINNLTIVGNLTRDPELRHTPSGTAVCSMRIAVNDRRPDGSGEWQDVAYYFDVTAWGRVADNCAQYLARGSKIGVVGKLTWREWETQDGQKRQAVEINAASVDFLSKSDRSSDDNSNQFEHPSASEAFAGADDDIPF